MSRRKEQHQLSSPTPLTPSAKAGLPNITPHETRIAEPRLSCSIPNRSQHVTYSAQHDVPTVGLHELASMPPPSDAAFDAEAIVHIRMTLGSSLRNLLPRKFGPWFPTKTFVADEACVVEPIFRFCTDEISYVSLAD